MNSEISQLSEWMNDELMSNSYKGEWKDFKNISQIFYELEWHKAKLLFAIRDGDKELQKEYLADCCNNFLFLANTLDLFKK